LIAILMYGPAWILAGMLSSKLYFYVADSNSTLVSLHKQLGLSGTQDDFLFVGPFLSACFIALNAFMFIGSSFRTDCYFRAGPKGLYIKLPEYQMFIYRLREQHLAWPQIAEIRQHTFTVNFARTSNVIKISGKASGDRMKRLRSLSQFLFREPIPQIIQQLSIVRDRSPYKPEAIV